MSRKHVTYALDFSAGRRGRGANKSLSLDRCLGDGEAAGHPISRIAWPLAIRFEGLVRQEKIRDYAEVARLGRVTRFSAVQDIRS